MSTREKDEVRFAVWLLGKVALSWGMSPSEAYRLLQREGIVKVTEGTIRAIEGIRLANLESEIVEMIGQSRGLGASEALSAYYTSAVCDMVERNEHGLQYLDARYLADEVIRELERT